MPEPIIAPRITRPQLSLAGLLDFLDALEPEWSELSPLLALFSAGEQHGLAEALECGDVH